MRKFMEKMRNRTFKDAVMTIVLLFPYALLFSAFSIINHLKQ